MVHEARSHSLASQPCKHSSFSACMITGFPKLVSPKAKHSKILFGHIKLTNPSVRMAYKGQSSFGITALLYTYRACKTLFEPIKPTNPPLRMAYKGLKSFGKPVIVVESQFMRSESHLTFLS